MPQTKALPLHCPSCGGGLIVKRLLCQGCETEVEGSYSFPPLVSLSKEDQEFVLDFIKASGSLKEMAKIMGISYPTVRNRLDEIIENLKKREIKAKD
jgi:hypothetical protein